MAGLDNFLHFLWLAVRIVTSCGFLCLDIQLLAFLKVLAGKPHNTAFSLLATARVFLRRKNFLHHFLCVHYFWAVLYPFKRHCESTCSVFSKNTTPGQQDLNLDPLIQS